MRNLSLIIGTLVLLTSLKLITPNPHGTDFKVSCAECHVTDSWKVNPDSITFDHNTTAMPLTGQHKQADCRSCHESLVFSDADPACNGCHTDMHYQTVGNDCARCHTSESWIVTDIIDLHQRTRFPLLGAHSMADCQQCHPSESLLRFEPLSIECYGCHQAEYAATTKPNHTVAGYSTNCEECHFVNSHSWMEFSTHDQEFFPIYSGRHNGVWSDCSDCHTNTSNYGEFNCLNCHEDGGHEGVSGYSYNSLACYACHPTGSREGSFNHNSTNFPLTGAHSTTDCLQCHTTTYAGTSTICSDCHQKDYNASVNPNHAEISLPNTCADCHTTEPGWKPATFQIHDQYYALNGAHALIASNCATCHSDNYVNTANTCIGCHQTDYDQANEPPHASAQFSTECLTCHNEVAWKPATFDHDAQYFPIYSGKHNAQWTNCVDCHTNPSNYAQFSCIDCHDHNQPVTDAAHQGIGGYAYNSPACFACHPTGDASAAFDHSTTAFPLTGAHITASCANCHTNGYAGTTTICGDCHVTDYNQATNPNHIALGIPNTCITCHTTEPGWQPATFPTHSQYYPLNGAHAAISANCTTCHNGNYNTTPNTCVGCHLTDYNQTANPPHASAQFSTECLTCHNETAWQPSTFNHDAQYFPIYSGKHNGQWSVCADCHTNPANYAQFSCIDCHQHNQADTDGQHQGIGGYSYNSPSCYACHPTGDASAAFNHSTTSFPLTGAHTVTTCTSCHTNGYAGTTTICGDCHATDYNQATNPSHTALGIPNTCITCHTTEPGWQPATFPTHNQYYQLNGAHAAIAANCATCHNGNYNTTPNTCVGCHLTDYNQTTNPPHASAQFSTDCLTCHTETAWQPSTFNHDAQYFPIYSGKHNGQWTVCADCHTNPANYAQFSCIDCHQHNQADTDGQHQGIGGYAYNSPSCYACHPTGDASAAFDHSTTTFPLTGAHTTTSCSSCHTNGYAGTTTICGDCHLTDYNQTTNPNHAAAGIPNTCVTCHTTQPGWQPASFPIHSNYYPLTGGHAVVAANCAGCHNGNYNTTPNTCAGCHTNNYNQTTNPSHTSLGLSTECLTCHTTNPGWNPALFPNHSNYYVIQGAHTTISNCDDCHNNNYNTTPNTCVGCHLTDYNQTNDPPHASAQYPTDCEICHSQNAWSPSTFNHDAQYFPIYSGSHNGEWNTCSDCHTNPSDYTVFTCITCHQQTNTNSQHQGVTGYQYNSNACYGCHPTGSGASGFNHSTSSFPLTGAHLTTPCESCHTNGYAGTTSVCSDCHITSYNQTTNPNHAAIGIPNTCSTCHTTEPGWQAATFPIHSNYYPLTGGHAVVSNNCAGCHNGNYNTTPNTCSGCHTNDFTQTTNPSHTSLGLSSECLTCHTTNPGWNPALFPNHSNYYVIQGAHTTISNCDDCHNNNYNTTPNTCVGCHLTDYNQTNDPAHASAQFPTNCEQCHTQNAWSPSTFNHDAQYFPIYSGNHNGEWNTCSECHTNPSNYAVFSCLSCHTQNNTNGDHQGVSGYQYNSNACYNCHPNGSAKSPFRLFNDQKN